MLMYFLKRPTDGAIKIGISTRMERRLAELRRKEGCELELLHVMEGKRRIEHHLHRHFAELALGHEWFLPGSRLLIFIQELQRREPAALAVLGAVTVRNGRCAGCW